MNLDLIIKVFQKIDKDLLDFMTPEEFKAHIDWRALEFWNELQEESNVYIEFMAK